MENPIQNYWDIRLKKIKLALEENNFQAFIAENAARARELVETEIIPSINPASISWGGSMTFMATGLYESLKNRPDCEIIDTFDRTVTREEVIEKRRQALLVDLFITGTNAVTETGVLVNLDMIGNRIGGITFGPRNVIILMGRNKVVADLDDAMFRIKNYAAPVNAMRLDTKTPCVATGYCEECRSPGRICNTWTVTEKSYPKGRVRIVLINEDLGF
jgi:L-lactate utilization protein LutB